MIALVILIIGIILLPFIPRIVGETTVTDNLRALFLMYLLNAIVSYLLTYKRSMLYASQKNYVISMIKSAVVILKNISQMLILLITKNFILFLIAQIICTILENLIINLSVNKKYPYIKDLTAVLDVDKKIKKDVMTKVKGLLFHKIGGFIVLGTDNIIISMTKGLGVIAVGMYNNYYMIINSAKTLFSTVINSLTASVGNLLIEKDKSKVRSIYQSMLLLNSWLFCFCSISIYCMIEPFIKIWIGEEYLLSKFVLIILVINLYVQGMRNTSNTFKEAAGIFYEDRFVPLIESIINIAMSLILVQILGLGGVFVGTIASTMVLLLYSYPKYVYKLVLGGTYLEYFKLHIKHGLVTLIICLFTAYLSNFIIIPNVWLQLILNGILCLLVPNTLYFLFAMKMPEFDFYKQKLKTILKLPTKMQHSS